MKTHSSWIPAVLAVSLLSACGGDGSDPTSAQEYAVSVAERHLLTDAGSWTVNGSDPTAGAFTATFSFTPRPDAAFPVTGAVLSLSQEDYTLVQAGVTTDVGGPTFYFDKASLSFLGADNGDGTCAVATASTAAPASAAVGANGPLMTRSELNLCSSGAGVVGATKVSWSLERDTGIALLCWNSTVTDATGATVEADSDCVEVAPDGTLGTKARLSIAALGHTITARNF